MLASPIKLVSSKCRSATRTCSRSSRRSLRHFAPEERRKANPWRRLSRQLSNLMRRNSAHPADAARRLDTKQKLELGVLVVKAGLREADRAFILGGLLNLARLDQNSAEAQRLRGIGRNAIQQESLEP